ncbi:MarR family winged helix-turn-helix transcriptional regulator [Methylocapsa sp. S129]|uniref:MarR family winged helix-turn-helix transcriptional regulator n=1 Tax=Methylocapsa sp. S129 TaxID=1641869 RepID=UPI00131DC724|nr:MarR family transcriptional regulator [Methylocapsa sp. S129]
MPSDTDEAAKLETGGPIDLSALVALIGYQLRRAQLAVFDDFIRSFADHNIRPSQYGVLTAIDRNPGSSQAAIAQSLAIKRSNFVKLIDEFERRKLVVRRQVAADRRANALYLTKAGQSVIEQFHAIRAAHEARISALIGSPKEQKLFLEQLSRLSALRETLED